jgi:hypothetical protein
MGNAQYLIRQLKMFVERQFRLGKFLILVPPISNAPGRKPLSFHAISFGKDASETTLRRMADLALNLQNKAPRPAPATIPSSFDTALNTVSTNVYRYNSNQANPYQVRLTETFLGIAESLRKPRGSLMH